MRKPFSGIDTDPHFSPSQSTFESRRGSRWLPLGHMSGVPAQALCIRDASKRQFLRIREDPLNFTIKQAKLSKQRFTTARRRRSQICFKGDELDGRRCTTAQLGRVRICLATTWTPSRNGNTMPVRNLSSVVKPIVKIAELHGPARPGSASWQQGRARCRCRATLNSNDRNG